MHFLFFCFEYSTDHFLFAFLPPMPLSPSQKVSHDACAFVFHCSWLSEVLTACTSWESELTFPKVLFSARSVSMCHQRETVRRVTPHINIFNLHEMRLHRAFWPAPIPVARAGNRISLSCGCFGISSLQKGGNLFWIKLLFLSISLVGGS